MSGDCTLLSGSEDVVGLNVVGDTEGVEEIISPPPLKVDGEVVGTFVEVVGPCEGWRVAGPDRVGEDVGRTEGEECVGWADGWETVGCLVGLETVGREDGLLLGRVEGVSDGENVGGVGLGVAHAPLSQLQASFAHASSQVLFGPSIINGEHPGAQSID